MLNEPYRIMIYSCHRLHIIVIDTLYSYDRLNQFDDINVLQKHYRLAIILVCDTRIPFI